MPSLGRPLRIVFLGPPGSGKGTQSLRISRKYCIPHISTGDLLRQTAGQDTELGLRVKVLIDDGNFVPDEMIISIVRETIKDSKYQKGFILDGFPRTLNQAHMLDGMLKDLGIKLDIILSLEAEDHILERRILGRLVHPASGRAYHSEYCPPKLPMTDDVTGDPLIRRADDNAKVLERRICAFNSMTAPIFDYYKHMGILHRINANESIEQVWSSIDQALSKTISGHHPCD